MRDLERLLTGAYPEGLRTSPPPRCGKAPSGTRPLKKLGLERPERQPLPHEQWEPGGAPW